MAARGPALVDLARLRRGAALGRVRGALAPDAARLTAVRGGRPLARRRWRIGRCGADGARVHAARPYELGRPDRAADRGALLRRARQPRADDRGDGFPWSHALRDRATRAARPDRARRAG